jgi:ketosteroid isomerase-like protein
LGEAKRLSEEKIVSVIRDFGEAYARRDVEKMLSFLTEDAVWVLPEGTFKGKEEVKRYLTWETRRIPDLKMRDAGIGIMVKGNKAVYEHVFEGSMPEGRRWREIPEIAVYEFTGEKIQQYRAYYDRLSMGKQVAKGWFEKKVVGFIVNRWEKGLH